MCAVRHYDWGMVAGGSDDSGGDIAPLDADYGTPEMFAGTLGAGVVTLNFTSETKNVTVRNTADADGIEYSFDSGATWFLVAAYGEATESVSVLSMQLRRAVAGAPTYEILAILTD